MAVGEVSAVRQFQRQYRISRFDQGKIGGHISLGAAVGLDVGMFRAEELLGAFDGQAFHIVDILATAVVAAIQLIVDLAGLFAPAIGIAFGIFVG